ncbi:MAG: hypothetical protein CMK89_17495 [Pseudomonadales bacterium]|nr:hypothetical protein [Pseudomonadales bacterium]
MVKTQGDCLDVFIVGGGISGAATAAECSLRGLSVTLCDRGDVGGASSSQSDQILPGAVHFLRNHNLPYFNKVIKEKALLKLRAPHLYRERAFVIVPAPGQRQSPISRIWLWLFQNWLQGGQGSQIAKRHADRQQTAPLRTTAPAPWVMEECMVDDARLVIENLILARRHHCRVLPHHEFVSAQRDSGKWQIQLRAANGDDITIHSRCIINASGVRVNEVQNRIRNSESRCWVELKRKLFVIIPKFYQGDHAYQIETGTGPVSITPFQEHYCLVSRVTGVSTQAEPGEPSRQEQADIITLINKHFDIQMNAGSVVKCYCIQQPVYSDDREASAEGVEDYALDLNCTDGRSPLVSIFGGSFATHRAMAEETVQMLGQYLKLSEESDTLAPLPGGDLQPAGFDQFILHVSSRFPWLPSHLLSHYCRTYGARSVQLLEKCKDIGDLGQRLCPGLYEREAAFLLQNEWVSCAEDILWRRTRLGLYAENDDVERLQNWIDKHLHSPSSKHEYTMWSNPVTSGRLH